MCTVSIQVPEEVLLCINKTEHDLAIYAGKILAMHLYKEHQISLGYGAQLAGLPVEDFIYELGRAGISIFSFDSEKEFQEDVANA